MLINDLMKKHGITRYELSERSGVSESTLRDIINGKSQLDRCESGTMVAIADVLGTTVEAIVVDYWDDQPKDDEPELRPVHDPNSTAYFYLLFDASVLDLTVHKDMDFVHEICRERCIENFFRSGFYRGALFMLGLLDYLHRKHGLDPNPRFDEYRGTCLDQPLYSLRTLEKNDNSEQFIRAKALAEKNAIPELARFNIFVTREDIDLKG